VRNIARLTMSMFGGADCSPMPCRRMDRTVTRNGKQVIMITRPGRRLSAVTIRMSCTARSASDTPSPSEIVISCAAAIGTSAIHKQTAGQRRARI
jgi:hypothetical protein